MKIQLRTRIRNVLEEMPEGATASEIGLRVRNKFNAPNQNVKEVAAVCAHDPLIAKAGTFMGSNTYVLKKNLD
mgnify:CR=1 FL=1